MYWPRTKWQKVPEMGCFWSPRRGPLRAGRAGGREAVLWICSTPAGAGRLPILSHRLLTAAL